MLCCRFHTLTNFITKLKLVLMVTFANYILLLNVPLLFRKYFCLLFLKKKESVCFVLNIFGNAIENMLHNSRFRSQTFFSASDKF